VSKYNIVRELLPTRAIIIDHVCTAEYLVNHFMKGLSREKVHNTSIKMGLGAYGKVNRS